MVSLVRKVVASELGCFVLKCRDRSVSRVEHRLPRSAAVEPLERRNVVHVRIGVDEPITDHRTRYVVSDQKVRDSPDLLSYLVMLELKGGIHFFGQSGTDSKNIAAIEETLGAAAQSADRLGSSPEWSDENDFGVRCSHADDLR